MKAQIRAHATLIGVVISVVRSTNLIPPINLPKTTVSTLAEIEVAAEQCRKHWKLGVDGPIREIREVLENAGVVVVNHLVKSQKVDTFSRYSASVAVIFPDQEIQSSSRWNFEIAHELGHLVMRRGVRTGSRETEEAANAFASAFMMPREAFAREFRELPFSWPHIFELKKRWHTSAAAALSRAYDLKLIEAVEYRKALKHNGALFSPWLALRLSGEHHLGSHVPHRLAGPILGD
jgi:Zn-dependent peptidase ImmA (M78 family)